VKYKELMNSLKEVVETAEKQGLTTKRIYLNLEHIYTIGNRLPEVEWNIVVEFNGGKVE